MRNCRLTNFLALSALWTMGTLSALTAGCSGPPLKPSLPAVVTDLPPPPPAPLVVTAISPGDGATYGFTRVRIIGSGFEPGVRVSLGGSLAANVSVGGRTAIYADTPAHAAGPVDLVITRPDGQQAIVAAGFTYIEKVGEPPPVVMTVTPALGSTAGGTTVALAGSGFQSGATVTFNGLPARLGSLDRPFVFGDRITLETPAHPAGPVIIVVTNPDGQSATLHGGYRYAAPESLDFNGDWEGGTGSLLEWTIPLRFTIENNVLVSASCADVPIVPSSPVAISHGEFTVVTDGVVVMTGRILSDTWAKGTIAKGPCKTDVWIATKGQFW